MIVDGGQNQNEQQEGNSMTSQVQKHATWWKGSGQEGRMDLLNRM